MGKTVARWSLSGAEAVLKLRALWTKGTAFATGHRLLGGPTNLPGSGADVEGTSAVR